MTTTFNDHFEQSTMACAQHDGWPLWTLHKWLVLNMVSDHFDGVLIHYHLRSLQIEHFDTYLP